jgi:hypothetical protein
VFVLGLDPCAAGSILFIGFLWSSHLILISSTDHSVSLIRSRSAAVICSSFSVEIASGTCPVASRVSRDGFLRSFSASLVKRAGDFSISHRRCLCPNQRQELLQFMSLCSPVRGAQACRDFSAARAPNRFLVFPLASRFGFSRDLFSHESKRVGVAPGPVFDRLCLSQIS